VTGATRATRASFDFCFLTPSQGNFSFVTQPVSVGLDFMTKNQKRDFPSPLDTLFRVIIVPTRARGARDARAREVVVRRRRRGAVASRDDAPEPVPSGSPATGENRGRRRRVDVRVISLVAPAPSARRSRVRARAPRVFGRGVRGVGRYVRGREDRDARDAVVPGEAAAVLRERQERGSQRRGAHGVTREPRRHRRGGDCGSDRGGTERIATTPRRGGARPARPGVRGRRDRRVGVAGHRGAGGGTRDRTLPTRRARGRDADDCFFPFTRLSLWWSKNDTRVRFRFRE